MLAVPLAVYWSYDITWSYDQNMRWRLIVCFLYQFNYWFISGYHLSCSKVITYIYYTIVWTAKCYSMSFALHKGLFLLRAFSSVSLFRDFHFHAIVAPHPHSISFLNCRNMLPVGSRLSHGLWRKRSISSRAAQLYNLAHSDTRPNDKSVSQQKNIFINSNIVTTKIYKESNIIRFVTLLLTGLKYVWIQSKTKCMFYCQV